MAAWPPPETTAALAALPRPPHPAVRWVPVDRLHITVRFLGEQPDPDPVAAALGDVAGTGPFEAVVGPATVWLPGRQVLVLPVAGLDPLAVAVAAALGACGGDERPFLGHLTLARVRGRRRGPPGLAGAACSTGFVLGEVTLVASRTGPGGSTYEVLARVPL